MAFQVLSPLAGVPLRHSGCHGYSGVGGENFPKPTAHQLRIDESIDQIREEIRELQEARNELVAISGLPPELLAQIFVYLRDTCRLDFKWERWRWLRVMAVCRWWRTVALGCSQLWTMIEDTQRSPRLAQEMLKRSNTAPLSVKIEASENYTPFLKQLATQHFHRIQSLDISCSQYRSTCLHQDSLRHVSMPSPQLEYLRLVLERSSWYRPSTWPEDRDRTSLPERILSNSPRLCEVELGAITIHWSSLSLCTQLRSLKLDNIHPRPTLPEILAVLRATPHLRILSLVRSLPVRREPNASDTPVRLNHLRHLKVEGHLHDCALIVSHLQHPSSTQIRIRSLAVNDLPIMLGHAQEILDSVAGQLQAPTQSPKFEIQSARILDSHLGVEISLYDQHLKFAQPPSDSHLNNPLISVVFNYTISQEFGARAIEHLVAHFDLLSLQSLDIRPGIYTLPSPITLCVSFGLLPRLEEIRVSTYLDCTLKDALLCTIEPSTEDVLHDHPSAPAQANGSPSPDMVYFSALKTFVFDNGDFGYSKYPETTDDLTDFLSFRHQYKLPIQRLVLNKSKRLRNWQIKQFLNYALSVEVDGEVTKLDGLVMGDDYETEYTNSEYDSSDFE